MIAKQGLSPQQRGVDHAFFDTLKIVEHDYRLIIDQPGKKLAIAIIEPPVEKQAFMFSLQLRQHVGAAGLRILMDHRAALPGNADIVAGIAGMNETPGKMFIIHGARHGPGTLADERADLNDRAYFEITNQAVQAPRGRKTDRTRVVIGPLSQGIERLQFIGQSPTLGLPGIRGLEQRFPENF